jgi:DNA-binding GntR family transcriptional regulator
VLQDQSRPDDTVARLYCQLRNMAADFTFRPSARINESQLSQTLGASRTPLREALNRLVAEGFLEFRSGQGFFCRALNPQAILNLYELREGVECAALALSVARAPQAGIDALHAYLEDTSAAYRDSTDVVALLEIDEGFHNRLCALAGNPEFDSLLRNINGRLRYVRSIDLKHLRQSGDVAGRLSAHSRIVEALVQRDATAALAAMRGHIAKRRDDVTVVVRDAFADLYAPEEGRS